MRILSFLRYAPVLIGIMGCPTDAGSVSGNTIGPIRTQLLATWHGKDCGVTNGPCNVGNGWVDYTMRIGQLDNDGYFGGDGTAFVCQVSGCGPQNVFTVSGHIDPSTGGVSATIRYTAGAGLNFVGTLNQTGTSILGKLTGQFYGPYDIDFRKQ